MVAKKQQSGERDAFERLLRWLDQDRDRAGEKYEEIRSRLISIFETRGCPLAEDLADTTFDRVAGKLVEIADTYVGRPELYFYGVAQNVYLEYVRNRPVELPPGSPDGIEALKELDAAEAERQHECLDTCLLELTPRNRRLILQYYQQEKHTHLEIRRQLAQRLGIGANALRIRVHRIRGTLADCITDCLRRKSH